MNRKRSFIRIVDAEACARQDVAARWETKRSRKLALLLVLVLCACSRRGTGTRPATASAQPKRADVVCQNDWQAVADGFEYRTLDCSADRVGLHVVRIDSTRAVFTAGPRDSSALFSINANFFDENFRPLGIVVSSGKRLNPPHPISWQSIFCIMQNGEPRIVRATEWDSVAANAVAGAQAGPRLLVDGVKNDVARATPNSRSGVCVDDNARALFFATPEGSTFDVWEMTGFAQTLGCRDAMLFDGGPSTQLFLRRAPLPVSVDGDRAVPAFVNASVRSK